MGNGRKSLAPRNKGLIDRRTSIGMQRADPNQYKFDDNSNIIQVNDEQRHLIDHIMEDNVSMNQEEYSDGDAGNSSDGGFDTDSQTGALPKIEISKTENVGK